MDEDGIDRRFCRIETDIFDLKVADKEHAKLTTEIEKSNIRSEGSLKELLAITHQLTDDVRTIKEKPMKNYEAIKIAIILFLVTNTIGIVWSMFVKQ